MAKRNIEPDSSDSDEPESRANGHSSAKRSRVDQSQGASSPVPVKKGKGKAVEEDAMDEDDDDDEDEEEEEEDSEEQERANTQFMEDMARKAKIKGTVATAGVIDQVELHDFMCHHFTTVNFGPQVNFLVGNNGSGKSAVLTGITMALGGNARNTNRASKSGGLVRSTGGATFAICSVRLLNTGHNAFQHKIYGDTITIERRINQDVSGGYKIFSHKKANTISRKKSTLDEILDHFNIQVDNPMTVLTQDQSRQFLASASAKDKYTFFLRGTQLAQLTLDYEIIRANTEGMQVALEKKREVIPEMKEAYSVAKARVKEAETALNLKAGIQTLKNDLVWSYVDQVQENVDRAANTLEKEGRDEPKIRALLATYKAEKEAAEEAIANMTEAAKETGNLDVLQAELEEVGRQFLKSKAGIRSFHDQEREVNGVITRLKDTIVHCEQLIREEREKLNRDVKAEQQVIHEQMESVDEEISKLTLQQTTARRRGEDIEESMRERVNRLNDLKDAMGNAWRDIDQHKARIASINRTKGDSLLRFGEKMPQLINAINKAQWAQKPIGPIGAYIKLQDQAFAPVIESLFSQFLNAIICKDRKDLNQMQQLSKGLGCHDVPILLVKLDRSERHKIELAKGEPDVNIKTVRRVLSYTGEAEWIETALLTGFQIEKQALVPMRPDGDNLLRQNPRNVGSAFSTDMFKLNGGSRGGSSSTFMPSWKGPPRLTTDNTAQLRQIEAEILEVQRVITTLEQDKSALDRELGASQRERQECITLAKSFTRKITSKTSELASLQLKLREEEPSDLAAKEAAKKEAEEELTSTTAQYQVFVAQKNKAAEEAKPLTMRKAELEKEIAGARKLQTKINAELELKYKERINKQSSEVQYETKLAKHFEKMEMHQKEADGFLRLLEERVEQAQAICDRPAEAITRTSTSIQKEIEAVEKAIKAREKSQGATVEEIQEEYLQRKRAVSKAVAAVKDLHMLIETLLNAYTYRITRWADFRDAMSARAKMQFSYHLSTRGFNGNLKFDHDKMKLTLKVQTEENLPGNTGTQSSKLKDTKQLSGGEKSFSTICLLLTMWEAVGCPLRCLDEFDVFMDAVNRMVSMKMMVDTAKSTAETQFILISPQGLGQDAGGKSNWGPEVRIHRMSDPGRSQGTLNFAT